MVVSAEPLLNDAVVNAVHPAKALVPMVFTFFPITTFFSFALFSNALEEMPVTLYLNPS